jgi:hypothetical protein
MATAANWRDKLRQIEGLEQVPALRPPAKTAISAKSPPFGSFGTFGMPSRNAERPSNRDAQGRPETDWPVPDARDTMEPPPSDSAGSQTPTIGTPDYFEERAALIEYGVGVPREWAEGFARLNLASPPHGFHERRWRTLIDDGGKFLDRWGAEAAQLGWSAEDVFGVHPIAPGARYDIAGLVLLIDGGEVIAIDRNSASIRTKSSGATLIYLRKPRPDAIVLWEMASPVVGSGGGLV